MGFKSKAHAFSLAKKNHMCLSCLHFQKKTFKVCPSCGEAGFRECFPSLAELKRACDLIRMQKRGEISQLKFHTRYDLKVEGVKICQYEPDAEYIKDGKLIIEDTKPAKTDFMDPLAKFKIKVFNALYAKHGLEVYIHRQY